MHGMAGVRQREAAETDDGIDNPFTHSSTAHLRRHDGWAVDVQLGFVEGGFGWWLCRRPQKHVRGRGSRVSL